MSEWSALIHLVRPRFVVYLPQGRYATLLTPSGRPVMVQAEDWRGKRRLGHMSLVFQIDDARSGTQMQHQH